MKFYFLILSILSFLVLKSQDSVLDYQLSFPRVMEANQSKFREIENLFKSKNLDFPSSRIFWRAFKWNKVLELWAYHSDSFKYVLVKSFTICEVVGDLGPKRQEGDFQIPEGFYFIENLNPNSKYHLSLRVSYPNKSDSILGKQGHLGGDIYVHGGCETIGCIPMNDDQIKSIYLINMYARYFGQLDIPIHIFPTKMTINNYNKMKKEYFNGQLEILDFWANIKEGYDFFESKRLLPIIEIDDNGIYIFK